MKTVNQMLESSNNVAEPAMTGTRDALEGFDLATQLYGRSRESHDLLMGFRRAAAGGAEVIVLSGPAGIGKTSLVRQMRGSVAQQRGYFISGKFDQLQRDVPFSAIVAALHDLVRQLLAENTPQTRVWRDAILAAVGRNGRVITDVVPALERIIGTQPPLPPLESTESQNRFNLVFQSFLQVFCGENRPLVVFLDDMQWADPASLRLLTLMLSAPGTHSLLMIASCRDNEIAATHPFMLAIKELERRTVPVKTVSLAPLGWSDIMQLISDSRVDPDAAASLAETIREKTGGNPFFIRQFLQKLKSDDLLSFDAATQTYRYDLAAIRNTAITENVADLIAQKIGRLDAQAQRIVSFGAAIGNRFDLATLASVAECTPERAAVLLSAAVREHLLVNPEGAGTPLMPMQYAFQHDRVQQAAYALVPGSARPALNLAIGRTLLAAAGEEVTGVLFEVVNHTNQGIALIDTRAERLRLAKLNLLAATRARNSTAYDLATRTCRSAVELLGWDAWSETYALAFEAHLRLAECQGLMADFEGAFATIDAALPNVRTPADSARLLTARTHTFLSMGDMTGAVECGREAARLFGLDLPERPEMVREQLQKEIGSIIAWSNEHPIESLLDLAPMADPDRIALMSLLMHCIPPAYQVNPELFALICCKMVSQSIEHGNCPMSAKGYGSFAVILSGIVGNHRDGDRFGKLGVDLCERLHDVTVRSACHFTWAAFASAWVRPIDESIEQFAEGVRWGLQSGDHPHAAYCAARAVTHMMFRGMPLAAARDATNEALQLLDRVSDATNVSLLRSRRRFIDWLQSDAAQDSLDGEGFDESALLQELQATSASKSMLSHFQALRVMQRYLAGNLAGAWNISRQSDELLPYSTGMITIAEHVFYQSLTMTALWARASADDRVDFAARLEAHLQTLKTWTDSCRYNFEPLYLAVRGEHARVLGETAQAGEFFEQAIASARAGNFTHVEAIACELAMKLWSPVDPARASAMQVRALAAYESWGAVRKVRALRAAALRS
jgi:predicted ATPase